MEGKKCCASLQSAMQRRRVWYSYYYASSLLEPCQPRSLIFLQSLFYYYFSIFIRYLSADFSVVRIPTCHVIFNANLDFGIAPPLWVFPYWPAQLFSYHLVNLDTGRLEASHRHTYTYTAIPGNIGWWSLLNLGKEELCKSVNYCNNLKFLLANASETQTVPMETALLLVLHQNSLQ
jgi:hypothetical protein